MAIHRGRKQAAFFLPGILVLISAVAVFAALGLTPGSGASAQSPYMLGIDVRPNGNGSVGVGQIEGCLSVEAGEEFFVDIVVTNVDQLRHWELRVEYDASVLTLEDADYNYFLVSAPGDRISFALFEAETDDRYFLAAVDFRGIADSGSGTLARLRFSAIGEGTSPVQIVDSPSLVGPRLVGDGGVPIGDSSGDRVWDGSVIDAEIEVGGDCNEIPIVTPPPSPDPTPQPSGDDSNPTNGSASDAGPDSGNGSEPTSGPAAIVLSEVSSGDSDEEPGPNEPDGESGSEGGASGGNDGDSDGGGGRLAADEGGSGFPWMVVALLASLGALTAGGGLLAYSRTRTG